MAGHHAIHPRASARGILAKASKMHTHPYRIIVVTNKKETTDILCIRWVVFEFITFSSSSPFELFFNIVF